MLASPPPLGARSRQERRFQSRKCEQKQLTVDTRNFRKRRLWKQEKKKMWGRGWKLEQKSRWSPDQLQEKK
ncbi:hypothetical protein AV530_017285 [Patagioenas fasciata monilis]|uniref:Uncharacterized protein n=1 Tax=Patagioenas fasciata monilis TaxID=372326 RepID=A0A1V4JFN7_PATFA|nr:hypothetical protein AV530_017285 [Patagioenas fasciata monilis]